MNPVLKIVTVVGARPQFVKAAMVSRAISAHNVEHADQQIQELIVHTGQHYDQNLSQVFFEEMQIPRPTQNLRIGSGTHGKVTGDMLAALETFMLEHIPDTLLVYGDTNSTLAGALAAAKLQVPVIHVEAGLRSFNRRMPEEVNRVLTDHLAKLLFCPTCAAVTHLATEGIHEGVYLVGDVMYDAALAFGVLAEQHDQVFTEIGITPGAYRLATVHRAENTDSPERLRSIVQALESIATASGPVVLPLHPRTAGALQQLGLSFKSPHVRVLDPLPFLDMVALEKQASLILTDSGGVQKEGYFHGVPVVTLREETEWTETVDAGWNQVAGWRTDEILKAVDAATPGQPIAEYGSGNAAGEIVSRILSSDMPGGR